jgi:hypothetical protein
LIRNVFKELLTFLTFSKIKDERMWEENVCFSVENDL